MRLLQLLFQVTLSSDAIDFGVITEVSNLTLKLNTSNSSSGHRMEGQSGSSLAEDPSNLLQTYRTPDIHDLHRVSYVCVLVGFFFISLENNEFLKFISKFHVI